MRSSRRALYSPQYVEGFRNALREARRDLDAMHERHSREMDRLQRELDECLAALRELRAAILAKQQAHAKLVGYHREREIQRARIAERDGQPLN